MFSDPESNKNKPESGRLRTQKKKKTIKINKKQIVKRFGIEGERSPACYTTTTTKICVSPPFNKDGGPPLTTKKKTKEQGYRIKKQNQIKFDIHNVMQKQVKERNP